ncbi:MAG: hypothetical protein NTW04_06195 [Elusimicrobia bacterium]|nr:hypothetical protein [Elusimicrobiota bacterium]
MDELKMYTRKGTRRSVPKIAITKDGQIGINAVCARNYFKDRIYVILYGDNKTIGIQPIDKEMDNSFKISYSANKSTGSISGRSFLNYLNINFSETKHYTPEWNEEKGMLIIRL